MLIANQAQGGKPTLGRHPPHLAVFAFADSEFDPVGGDFLAEADRADVRGHRPGGSGMILAVAGWVMKSPRSTPWRSCLQRFRCGRAFHLRPVGLGLLVAGVADFVLQLAIIG